MIETIAPPIATTPEIDALIDNNAPIAIGVSGGKDSCALAFAMRDFLDEIDHTGPRLLIHSDLGRVEWKDSGPTCARLAEATGMELMTVRRNAGDMMDRWQGRWKANVKRYEELSCVQLILPWSTPSMRFCTSELKTDVICGNLKKRFKGQAIVSASGIRREESTNRAKAPVAKRQPKLGQGWDWHPIIDWTIEDVYAICDQNGFEMHEAYRVYGSTRVSCAFCIMSTLADLTAGASAEQNADLYREMVDLEIRSTFGFQGNRWLADVAGHLLDENDRVAVALAKIAAERRQVAEARIPKHLLYTAGWPTCIPTTEEAKLLASVRREVSELVGLDAKHLDAASIVGRYEELMNEKHTREARKKRELHALLV